LNPGLGEIFHTCPDRSSGPLSLLHNGYQVSLPGVKRPERGIHHPSASSVEFKEIVEIYRYFLSGPSWRFTLIIIIIIIIIIFTKHYATKILNTETDSKCRLCQQFDERVDHIISACPILAKEQYIKDMIECVHNYTLTYARKQGYNWTKNSGMNMCQNQ